MGQSGHLAMLWSEDSAHQTAERRFQTSLIGLFSFVALLLSAIGIYGLMHSARSD
jgi:hypothetical protein